MNQKLPIIYSAHHASHDFWTFTNRCALSLEQRVRYSDYGTDITVPRHSKYVVGRFSRGLVDLNRSPDSETLFPKVDFGKPQKNNIWLPGQEPIENERKIFHETIYNDYHQRLLAEIQSLDDASTDPIILVAWDNTAHYAIGKNSDGSPRMMQPFILSNDGDREKGASSNPNVKTTCRPDFLIALADNFRASLRRRGLPDDVHLNTYDDAPNDECGYIARHYNTIHSPHLTQNRIVEALQLEYDAGITHNVNLCPDYGAMEQLRFAFEETMETSYKNIYL